MNVNHVQESQGGKEWSPATVGAVCILIIAATFAFDLQQPLGIASAIPYTLAVLVASFGRSRRVLLGVTFITSILTLEGIWFSPRGPVGWTWEIFFYNRGLVLLSLWILAFLLDHRNRLQANRDQALARVRVLEGLLPICAECKKIRDDSNVWHRMEVFITNHSEATFTHGLCPECSQLALEQYRKERPQGSRQSF